MDITARAFDPTTLWVKEGRLHCGPTLASATPLEGADSSPFYVEKVDMRGDDLPPAGAPGTTR